MSASPRPLDAAPTLGRQEIAHWRALFSVDSKEAEDRRVLRQRLEAWSRAHEGVGVGLVREDDEKATVFVSAGKDRPAEGSRVADDLEAGWSRVAIPGGSVLLGPGAPTEPDRDLLLLSAGVRIACLKKELVEHTFQAKFRGVELEALYDVGLSIAATLDLEELSEAILLHSVSLLDARRGALYLVDGEGFDLASTIGGQARPSIPVAEVDLDAVRGGRDGGLETSLPGTAHRLVVPVEVDGALRGLLMVADKESRTGVGPFPDRDRRTLGLFANQAALALENAKLHRLALEKERLEREMELAAEIQQQILPKAIPTFPAFEVLGWNRPARQVGGDYFHLRGPEAGGRPSFVVGDVTGKGLPAALLVSTLHSALRLLSDRMDVGPELVERLNHHVYESSSLNKFITLLIATISDDGKVFQYVNAGHNPGVVLRADGTVALLESGGLPLGLLSETRYEGASVELGPGDLVCLYSDGITECERPDEEEYGLERLIELLREHRETPLGGIVRAIDEAVTDFAAGLPQGDDQTVVLLRPR